MNKKSNKLSPCDRFLQYGIQSLSDDELLALVLRNGNKKLDVYGIVDELSKGIHSRTEGLSGLLGLSYEDFLSIPGIGSVKASQLMALVEISRRIRCDSAKNRLVFSSPDSVSEYYMDKFRGKAKEHFTVLFLDSALRLISEELIGIGTGSQVNVEPREVFSKALCCSASYIILMHNHPSGRTYPSDSDRTLTLHFYEMGEFLGVKLLDHLILGDNEYFSFKEHDFFRRNLN